MIKSVKQKVILYVLVPLLLVSFAVGLMIIKIVPSSATVTLSEIPLEKEYLLGTELTLPSATITVDGKPIPATTELTWPNGKTTVSETALLDQTGSYSVNYRAVSNGKVYSEKKRFTVYQTLYSVSSKRSKAYFGEPMQDCVKADGINISLMSGDTFTYNKVLDLSQNTATDDFIKFGITPQSIGSRDCTGLMFTLTDAYDSTNKVTIAVTAYPTFGTPSAYIKTAATGQPLTGYEHREDGRESKVWVGGEYGNPVYLSFEGVPYQSMPDNTTSIRYDHEKKQIHSDSRTSSNKLVADLDDSFFYTNRWNGFTTGEVYLSVQATGYSKSSANFIITKIGDEDLQTEKLYDTVKPNISIDLDGYAMTELPVAEVNKAYPLFTATAVDAVSGIVSVRPAVYTGYYTSNKSNVTVTNNAFTPAVAQTHYIEYSAVDGAGNIKTFVLTVPVVQSLEIPLTVSVSEDRAVTGVCGEKLFAADYTASGGSGRVQVKVTVEKDGEQIAVGNDLSYRIYESGVYTVNYTATDYLETTVTDSYTVEIKSGNSPVFIEEPVMPKYLISGYENPLPFVSAYNYTDSSGTAVDVVVTINENGTVKTLDGFTYKPETKSDTAVDVTYTASLSGGGTAEITYEDIPVICIGEKNKIEMPAYFAATDMIVAKDGEDVVLRPFGTEPRAEFINPLLTSNLSVVFGFSSNKYTSEMNVYLQDSLNPSIKLKLGYSRQSDGRASVKLNDSDYTSVLISEATFTNGNRFTLKYNDSIKAFTVDGTANTRISIDKTLSGAEFNGFPSKKVYITFELPDESTAELRLRSLNNQQMGVTADNGRPDIDTGRSGTAADIDTRFTIPRATYSDVLDPGVQCSVTVYAPGFKIATDIYGNRLDNVPADREYTIDLSEYGNYEVLFYAEDSAGRKQEDRGYVIRVMDKTPPEITLNGIISNEYEMGDIYLPTAVAKDNLDENVTVIYMLVDPDGRIHYLTNGACSVTKKGVYTARYMAYDSAGNLAINEYSFSVV